MTRKDSEKDADRPHYYSQFWLDIAAGRRVIGGPRPDEAEASEPEIPEPVLVRKGGRSNGNGADGYKDIYPSAVIETAVEEDEADLATVEDNELPNIVLDDLADEPEEEEVDLDDADEEPEEEELYGEEEEEEEDEWSPRGRKKAKPVKPVKPVKKAKREPRRSGF